MQEYDDDYDDQFDDWGLREGAAPATADRVDVEEIRKYVGTFLGWLYVAV
jgi:hypothetical protein